MLQGPTHGDWLVETLCTDPYNFFVSGSDITSKKYIDAGLISLRFVGHFPPYMQRPPHPTEEQRMLWLPSHYKLMMGILIVELSAQKEVDAFKVSDRLLALKNRFHSIFHTDIVILAYTKEERPGGLGICARYWVSDSFLNIDGLIDPVDYAQNINSRRNPSQWEAPVIKPINKTTRDHFQRWTRAYLSTQLAINDIDACRTLDTDIGKRIFVICELKRTGTASLETWKPYLDDIPNFMLAKACARVSTDPAVVDLTVHYSVQSPNELAFHIITSVSRENITGFRKIIRGSDPGNTIGSFVRAVTFMVDNAYVSTNVIHR